MKFNFKKFLPVNLCQIWQCILLVFVLLLIAVFLINGYLFLGFKKNIEKGVLPELPIMKTIRRTVLEEIAEELKNKQERFEQNLVNPSKIFDPS